MSKSANPHRKPAWTADPVPCEDCGDLIEFDCWKPGQKPSVCRRCQNRRYEEKQRGTPAAERRRRRSSLRAKLRRLEARMKRDQATHVHLIEELAKETRQ